MRLGGRAAILAAATAALPFASAGADEAQLSEGGLQPYQMVRSLELVQDRIAGGDHAALPMQKKLLEMIDARFRAAAGREFAERRNFDALMVYAMSGGNPATVAASLGALALDDADKAATTGVLRYLEGDIVGAQQAMARVDPAHHTPEVAAFLALVKGSVLAGSDAGAGLALLDRARLLAPGTLVEEAALRRTLSLRAAEGNAVRFMQTAEQYSRRFLRSPYAAQFAETFVSGILELRTSIDLAMVEQAVSWMTREQAQTVYLRLARRAAIDGDTELLAFASARATDAPSPTPDARDVRGELYASISSVTSATVEEVLARLSKLDASQLSASDRDLLAAARAIASEVVAPVSPVSPIGAPAEAAPDDAAGEAEIAEDTPDIGQPDPFVTSARARLDEVDRILMETKP